MAFSGRDGRRMTGTLVRERRTRRAHWRSQRHGPDRCLRKRVHIEQSTAYVLVRRSPNLELPF